MSDVARHRPPFRVRAEEFTNRPVFGVALVLAAVLISLLCIGGAVYTIHETDGPGYEPPPRNAYEIGGQP